MEGAEAGGTEAMDGDLESWEPVVEVVMCWIGAVGSLPDVVAFWISAVGSDGVG